MSIFFHKNGSTKEAKSNKHKRKKLKVFKVRPTYNELQIMTTMYLKPSKMSQVRVCSWMYVCFKKGPWSVQESVKNQRGPSCGSLGGSRRVSNTAPVHLHSTLPEIWDQTERSPILKINQNKKKTIACVDLGQVNYSCVSSDFYSHTSKIKKKCDPGCCSNREH